MPLAPSSQTVTNSVSLAANTWAPPFPISVHPRGPGSLHTTPRNSSETQWSRSGKSPPLGREVASDCYFYFYFSKTSASPLSRGDKDCVLPTGFRFYPVLDPQQPGAVSICPPQGPGQGPGRNAFLTRATFLRLRAIVY